MYKIALKTILGISILLAVVFPAFPQYSNLKFSHLTIEDGLSSSVVQDIVQDGRGYMWFATNYGLNYYDGYEFKVYYNSKSDTLSVAENRIAAVCEDAEGDIIVATWSSGIGVMNRNTGKFKNYKHNSNNKNSIPNDFVRKIIVDKKGNIWLASIGSGLVLFDKKKGKFRAFSPPNSSSKQVYQISLSNTGQIIVPFVDEGVFLFDTETFQFSKIEDFTSGRTIHGIGLIKKAKQTSDGLLWISTEGDGIYVYDFITKKNKHFTTISGNVTSLGSNGVRDINEDNKGIVWIATDGGGLNRFDKKTETFERCVYQINNSSSISTDQIYNIYIDRTGIFWIGTFSGGVNIYDPNKEKFSSFKPEPANKDALSYKSVLAIMEDNEKNIWIGTDGGGVNIYNPSKYGNKFIHFTDDVLKSNFPSLKVVKSIYQDKQQNIWFGTYKGGLVKYNPKTRQIHNYWVSVAPNGLPSNLIWALLEDSYGKFWVSSLGTGVSVMDREKETFKVYKSDNSHGALSQLNVMTIYEDRQRRLWLGTEGGGVNLYDRSNDKFIIFRNNPNDKNSLSNDDVRTIFQDSDGNLWFGTIGGGLDLFLPETKSFKHFTTSNGLPANAIYGILEDDDKNLWISTNNGICKFNYKKNTFKIYDINDGLQSNEFNYTSSCKTSDGTFLFGGIEGFNAFHPSSVKDNEVVPPVYITDLFIFNQQVVPGDQFQVLEKPISSVKEVRLSYNYNVFTIKFSALNYTNTVKNKYAYILEKFEKKWNYVGNKREATYTNLDPGVYTFKVKACNNDGVWNETGASIRIIIDPPWYNKAWANSIKVVLGIFAIYILFLFIEQKFVKQRKKLEAEKKQKLLIQQRMYEEEALDAERQILLLKNQQLINDKQVFEQEKQLRIKEEQHKDEQRKAEQEILSLQQEKLENDISFKSKELASLALSNSHKNEILISIKDDLEIIISDKLPEPANSSLRKIISSIQNDLNLDDNWNQFELHFDQVHENFLKRLKEKFPQLKPTYLKLCAYIRMRLTSKQISALMNSTIASVEKSRYRLREKLNMEEGQKLTEFIEKF